MIDDYIEDIDFSVTMIKPHTPIPWEKILKKVKEKKKPYSERDYAFGIYQELPIPPNEKDKIMLTPDSELLFK